MNPTTLGLLTFAVVTLLAWGVVHFVNEVLLKYRTSLNERLDSISKPAASAITTSSLFREGVKLSIPSDELRPGLADRWRSWLESSGTRLKGQHLAGMSIGFGLLLAGIGQGTTKIWWVAGIGLLCGAITPIAWISVTHRRRMKLLIKQLPEAFDVMSRAVRAGQTVPAAFQTIADDFEAPISHEFRCCYEEQNLGIPYETALRNLARRAGIMELQILVVALLVHGRCGGNLVELLQSLSSMVRKRQSLEGKIKALTSEGRLQALILMILPVAAFVAISLISPNYVGALLTRPWLLAGTIGAQALGALWIRKIVQIEY